MESTFELEARLRAIEAQIAQLTARLYRIEQQLKSQTDLQQGTTESRPQATQDFLQSLRSQVRESALASSPQPAPTPAAETTKRQMSPESIPADRLVSLESVVGGQWLNRLGILAVLVGLSYFLKLAFEHNWIGPSSRVISGLVCGTGLLLWSERFRRRGFAAFAYSLKAVGIGALYLSLWAASQFYHLVPTGVAFAGMVAVTLASAAMSLAQNAELLAAGALVGGFLTPVLLSTKQNQEVALLSYLLLLDLGVFWIVRVKGWARLLPGAFLGTALLSAGWAVKYYSELELATTLVFAALFFLLFAIAPVISFMRTLPEHERRLRTGLILANAIAYFGVLFLMLWSKHQDLLAGLVFSVAAFYMLLSRILRRRRQASAALEGLLWLLAIAFVTVGIPIELNGYWITFTWNIEAAVLVWVAHRLMNRKLRVAGAVVLALTVVRLITESENEPRLLLNSRFGLYLLTIAVASLLVWVSLRFADERSRNWAGAGTILVNLLALGALGLEIRDYFLPQLQTTRGPDWRALRVEEAFSFSALWMLYGVALMTVGFRARQPFLRWQAIVLLGVTAIKVFFYDISTLERGYRIASFIVLGAILLGVSFFYQRSRISSAE